MHSNNLAVLTLSMICFMFASSSGSAQWTKKGHVSGIAAGNTLGASVAVDSRGMIVGSPNEGGTGAVRAIWHDGQSEQTLLAPDGAFGDRFGDAVAVAGATALVGAPQNQGALGSGAAYIYRYTGQQWAFQQKITPSEATQSFGFRVSVYGGVCVVGDKERAVYVFRSDGTTWTEEARLTASNGTPGDRFGYSVSLTRGLLCVGAFFDGDAGFRSGAVYVYRYDGSTWVEETKLIAADAMPDDNLGHSVAVNGNIVVIGAPQSSASSIGSAYIFRNDGIGWIFEEKFQSSLVASFGWSVATTGDRIAIGEINGSPPQGIGSVHMYRYDGTNWIPTVEITLEDGTSLNRFGWSLSLSNGHLAVGEPFRDASLGSAHLFTLGVCVTGEISSHPNALSGKPVRSW